MAFKRIPETLTPKEVLDTLFKQGSKYVPALTMLIINQTGQLALVRGIDKVTIRFPEGIIYRPKNLGETAIDKVYDTATTRTNATLGPLARVTLDLVEVQPYVNLIEGKVDREEKIRWPLAEGKVFLPAVVPVYVYGDDPKQKYDIIWKDPDQALALLQNSSNRLVGNNSPAHSALEALQFSMDSIMLITG